MNRSYQILSVSALLVATLATLWVASDGTNADDLSTKSIKSNESLVGTWRMVSSGISNSSAGAASGINTRLKIYNDTHWCMVQPNPDSGKVVFVHGGSYKFDGVQLEEKVEFAGEDTTDLIGKALKYRVVLRDGSFEQIDPNGVFNEKWNRVGKMAN